MVRLTKSNNNTDFYVEETEINHTDKGYCGNAINRLALFENIYDDVFKSQIELHNELEKLRVEGKTKSLKFKELMIKKLTNTNAIILFESYGLKNKK